MAIGTHTVGLHLGSPQIKMPEIILYVAFYVLLYYPPQPAQSAMFHILHEYMTRTLLILRLVSRKKYHQILNSYINVYDPCIIDMSIYVYKWTHQH